MKHVLAITLALALATPASAACYADYKAKQDDPLRLHYGVIELPDGVCGDSGAASAEAARRLQGAGWQLIKLQSIFGPDGLDQKKADAGEYFLRF
jgi:hypothetical protein